MVVRRYSEEDEAFLRQLIVPEEDRRLFTLKKWVSGYRWFRSPKVMPIEYWQRRSAPAPEPGFRKAG